MILLNCDMGEGMGNEELLMPFIHAANIACGYHAGDIDTINETVALCCKYGVEIGAHPSFLDKENFGRTNMNVSAEETYDLVSQQLFILNEVVAGFEKKITHVKPHGALYNLSARDGIVAHAIASAVKDFDHSLTVYGLSGSISITEAARLGLKTANEVFADRSYQDDGTLTPRSFENSLLDNIPAMIKQVSGFIYEGSVLSTNGKKIMVSVDTICIHGDGAHAIEFAREIRKML